MTAMVQGLFGNSSATRAAAQERELARISQLRQQQTADDQSARTAGQYAVAKSTRGSRLLLSEKEGGLATTLG